MGVKTACDDPVEDQQCRSDFAGQRTTQNFEIGLMIENMQMLRYHLVRQLLPSEGHQLIKNTQRISQRSICLHRHDVQSSFFGFDSFLRANALQMCHHVRHSDAMEIKDLATRQDRGKNFMLFGCSQNKHRMRWRFLQRLQESVKRRLRKHVHLIDDVHFILTALRRDPHLVYNGSNVFNLIVGGGIQFKDIERIVFS